MAWPVRRAYPRRIDHRGLHKTNVWLLRQVVLALEVRPDFVLADGFALRSIGVPQLAVKKGDMTCASVAAASIMAKVSRDRAMDRYHRRFPQYGFDRHKGYGTPSHRAAIALHGPVGDPSDVVQRDDHVPDATRGLRGEVRSAARRRGRPMRIEEDGIVSDEDIERYEDDMELRLWQEYRDVLPMFAYVVETERRFYLATRST